MLSVCHASLEERSIPADFSFFSRARSNKRQGSDEEVRLHALGLLVIDGPHFDHILESGKCPLHFTEIFVDFHGFDRGEILFLALDEVLAFQSFFRLEVFRVFKIVEVAVAEFPSVVSKSVVASEHSAGRRALCRFQRYEKDMPRKVWFYRDWVINALNRDMPYNQFIIDQIAGDMLPNATQDDVVATGFLRNSMLNEEGGVDPEQFRMVAMFDRVDAIGKGILGLTIQCAQCHNHKFDPLKQEEYYRMFALLNNASEGSVAVYTPQEQMKRAEIFRRTREIEAGLLHHNPDWQDGMAKWEEQVSQGQPEWAVVRPTVDIPSTGGQKYLPMKDGSFLAQGYAPPAHRVKMTVRTDMKNITAFRLELLTDPNLPLGGRGAPSGERAH